MAELAGLTRLSPAEAHLRQAVPTALSGRRVGEATMITGFGTSRRSALSWFACEAELAFAIERAAGTDCCLAPGSGVEAVRVLEAVEPVLSEIERGLGIALEPLELVPSAPADSIVATVSTLCGDQIRDRLSLALPATIELLPTPAPFAPELLGMVSLTASVMIPGPRVEPHDAAELRHGDLLLLGQGLLTASLKIGEGRPMPGRFDPVRKCFQTD